MFNLQGSEIIVILLLALVVLGPEKLPDAIRRFSQTYAELKKMGSGFQSELKSALDEPMREMRETADLVMNAADPQKIAEQAEAEVAARTQSEAAADPIDARAYLVNDPGAGAGPTDGDEPGADDKPVNQIAAANSSAALAAASLSAEPEPEPEPGPDAGAEPEPEDDAGEVVPGDPPEEPPIEAAASPAETAVAPGPAFHSAAPPAPHANGADPATDSPVSGVAADDDAADDVATGDVTGASEEANAS